MKTRFYECLVLIRKRRGYTQAQMARILGISCSVYENYERGGDTPDFEMLERISDILDCSLDELFGRKRKLYGKVPDILREPEEQYLAGMKKLQKRNDRRLAIGVQDFRMLREQKGYYVDKTHMIEEFLDCTKDSGDIFAGTKICESDFVEEMNRHPVVSLSFLNVKAGSAEGMLYQLKDALCAEYERYHPVIYDGTLSDADKK